jgi:hypothetical protein
MDNCSTKSCSACGPWWRLPLMLALVLAAIWLMRGRGLRESSTEPGGEDPTASIGSIEAEAGAVTAVAVDFGDGRLREYEDVPWREGMTVRDALAALDDASDGMRFSQRGSGELALLTGIEGVENEGAGARNWTYTVNGKLADRSFAIYPLRPGDRVLWKFAAQD